MRKTTLPIDSAARKEYPLLSGCLKYFPAALAGIAKISKQGNDKHNPGQEMHHARGKSADHGDCILRHITDTEDLLAAYNRGEAVSSEQVLTEASQLAWRALAYSQQLHEQFGAPLAPGAVVASKVAPKSEGEQLLLFEQVAKDSLNKTTELFNKFANEHYNDEQKFQQAVRSEFIFERE